MPRPLRTPLRLAAASGLALLFLGSPASAATRADTAPPTASEAATWKGRFCTANSCRSTPASPLGAAASFGAAILAIRWLSRRREHRLPLDPA